MNTRQKSKFVRHLTKAVTKQILDRVPDMPEEWAAIELRQYVADMFERNCLGIRAQHSAMGDRQRRNAYKHAVAERKL
jgi:hypothetical protein